MNFLGFQHIAFWFLFSIQCFGLALPNSNKPRCAISDGAPLRILPLGDSITFGYNEASGNSYRRDLECLLYTGGNPVEYVGQIKNGDWDNNENDGFVLHTLDEISQAAVPDLTAELKPNVVLLHGGTVDLVLGVNVTTAPRRLGNFIDLITTNLPDALVVVAQPVINNNSTVNALIQKYNSKIPSVVATRARAGKKVTVTSMLGVTPDELPDGTHLNEAGSRKVAYDWYAALVEAGERGWITPAAGDFVDRGASSLPASGKCEDLID